MKHFSMAAAVSGLLLAGSASAGAPTGDPIKDGQTATGNSTSAAKTGDPIKDGQTVMAVTGNDLGAAAPNRANYSQSPSWQAFVYERGGVRYIQLNDAEGVVHAVVAIGANGVAVLPLGVDAEHVVFGAPEGAAVTVYRDASTLIVQQQGQWFVEPAAQ